MGSLLHKAALVPTAKAPFEIKSVSTASPGAGQILVRNSAIAINPIDYKLAKLAIYPLNYPVILGQDVSGTVVSVGPDVTGFQPGDRVIGCTAGFATKDDAEKAFQECAVLQKNLACPIPDNLGFESAVVLPLAVTTASAGLFNSDLLNLHLPAHPARGSTGEVLLVWGGAGSVGSAAIQLAVAAGYTVTTTASAKNFDHVKRLGASQVFDYSSPTVVEDIVAALNGKHLAGAFDSVGGAAWKPTMEIVARSSGKKAIATVVRGFPDPPEGVPIKWMNSLSIMANGVADAVWVDYLPKALKAGTFMAAPEPLVAGHGLESLQVAVDKMGEGVSARKIIVTL